jgi:chromosome segregation ATPase
MRLKCGKDSEDEESCDCLERLLHEQEEKIYRMEAALEELRGDRDSMLDEIEGLNADLLCRDEIIRDLQNDALGLSLKIQGLLEDLREYRGVLSPDDIHPDQFESRLAEIEAKADAEAADKP